METPATGMSSSADAARARRHKVPGRPNRFEIDLVPYGLYTHLDVPDDPRAREYIAWQIERYARVCAGLKQLGIDVPVKMVASNAVLRFDIEHGILVGVHERMHEVDVAANRALEQLLAGTELAGGEELDLEADAGGIDVRLIFGSRGSCGRDPDPHCAR